MSYRITLKHALLTSLFLSCAFAPPAFSEDTAPQAITFAIQTFTLEGESPIDIDEMADLLSSFENKDYGLAELQTVSQAIEKHIRDAGFAFYRVVLPPQSLADGSVSFKLVSFALGDIAIKGHSNFDDANIYASLPELVLGTSPNTKTLTEQIKVANHHVAKEVSVTFKQSDVADKVSATVDVIEDKPLQFSLIANNTGTDDSGNARITAATQHNNLWNKDHNLNLSYTTSPNHTSEVKQYGASYSLPLYQAGGWLTGYYAFSDIDTGSISGVGGIGLDVSGSGEMFGLHYLHFLPKIGNYEHTVDVGFDNRFFDNTVIFSDAFTTTGDIAPEVRSTPLTLLYKGNLPLQSIYIAHHVSWSKNLGIGSRNDDTAYGESRYKSKKDWDLIRYGIFTTMDIKGWLLKASLKGQYSNEPLISGEQFGLGGSYSVRGYNERESSMDIGNSISFEAFTPAWKNIKLVGFYDYGKGRNHDILPEGLEKDVHLASVGVGLRWQWKTNLLASIDLGHTLKEGSDTSNNHNHAHANLIVQY